MTREHLWQLLTEHAARVSVVAASLAVASFALVTWVLVRMPQDYFVGDKPPPFLDGYPLWVRVVATLGKSLVAWVLIVLGLVMAIPGVPGQGLLTVLVGVLLADFPGKRGLERRVARIHAVHAVVDRLRGRFGRPPLLGL